MGNVMRGALLAATASLLAGCSGSVEDRINAAVPPSKELEAAKAAFDAAAIAMKADASALNGDYKAQLKIRALECSRGVEPSMFSSKESIRKEVGNEECFKAADAKLLTWLGLRRIGWSASMPALHPIPAQPVGLLPGVEGITGTAFAEQAGVAVLQSRSAYAVMKLDGTEIRRGVSSSSGQTSLSPNGRLMVIGSADDTRILDTDSGEVLATLPELRAARVFWAGDKGLVYVAKEGGGVAYRDLATGVQTILPMTTYYLSGVVRVSPREHKYLLIGSGRMGTLELAPDGQGMKPTLTNEIKLESDGMGGDSKLTPAHGALVFAGRAGFNRVNLADMSTETVETNPLRITSVVPTADPDRVLVTMYGGRNDGSTSIQSYSFRAKTLTKVDSSTLLSTRLMYLPSIRRNAVIDGAKVVLLGALPMAGAPEYLVDAVHKVKFEQQLAQLEAMDRMQQMPSSVRGSNSRYGVTPPAPPPATIGAAPRFSSGRAGLVEAIRAGVLRLGGPSDLDAWKMAYMTKNRRMPGKDFDERTRHTAVYVVTGNMTIPTDLDGANSVMFVVNPGVPFPQGNTNHSPILDVSSGQCSGNICDMYLR